MNWMESLLTVAGISLDIFAAMECQGSLIDRVDKKRLFEICTFVAFCQLAALYLGYYLSMLYCRQKPQTNERLLGEIISMIIFFGLGIRLLAKAIRNEHVEEHLETNLEMKRFIRIAGGTAVYTVLTGVAFGFLEADIITILIMTVIITVAVIIGGMYTGYRFGFAAKTKVYIIGTILLSVAGLDVLIRRILQNG